jgi:hypothetical protein
MNEQTVAALSAHPRLSNVCIFYEWDDPRAGPPDVYTFHEWNNLHPGPPRVTVRATIARGKGWKDNARMSLEIDEALLAYPDTIAEMMIRMAEQEVAGRLV